MVGGIAAMPNYTVTPGDCFNSIAKAQGFFNYQTIYKEGENKKKFPNANMLTQGAVVEVPDKKQKKIALILDAEKKLKLDRRKTRLRVVLLDADFKPVKVIACKTHVGIDSTKLPDGNGLIELSDTARALTDVAIQIEFKVTPPPPAAPAPAAKVDPKAYPACSVFADSLYMD